MIRLTILDTVWYGRYWHTFPIYLQTKLQYSHPGGPYFEITATSAVTVLLTFLEVWLCSCWKREIPERFSGEDHSELLKQMAVTVSFSNISYFRPARTDRSILLAVLTQNIKFSPGVGTAAILEWCDPLREVAKNSFLCAELIDTPCRIVRRWRNSATCLFT
jgi:hypothetical protein